MKYTKRRLNDAAVHGSPAGGLPVRVRLGSADARRDAPGQNQLSGEIVVITEPGASGGD